MPEQNPIVERIEQLRNRAERFRLLAAVHHNRRTAAEVVGFADELEAEAARLERWRRSMRMRDAADAPHAA